MKMINVNTSSPYPVIVDSCLLKETGEYIRKYAPAAGKTAVITDDTVDGLYGDTVRESIRGAGLDVCTFVLPHGEASKKRRKLS